MNFVMKFYKARVYAVFKGSIEFSSLSLAILENPRKSSVSGVLFFPYDKDMTTVFCSKQGVLVKRFVIILS